MYNIAFLNNASGKSCWSVDSTLLYVLCRDSYVTVAFRSTSSSLNPRTASLSTVKQPLLLDLIDTDP